MADAELAARPAMSTFERYLSIGVLLCIVVGIGLGAALPGAFATIAAAPPRQWGTSPAAAAAGLGILDDRICDRDC